MTSDEIEKARVKKRIDTLAPSPFGKKTKLKKENLC